MKKNVRFDVRIYKNNVSGFCEFKTSRAEKKKLNSNGTTMKYKVVME